MPTVMLVLLVARTRQSRKISRALRSFKVSDDPGVGGMVGGGGKEASAQAAIAHRQYKHGVTAVAHTHLGTAITHTAESRRDHQRRLTSNRLPLLQQTILKIEDHVTRFSAHGTPQKVVANPVDTNAAPRNRHVIVWRGGGGGRETAPNNSIRVSYPAMEQCENGVDVTGARTLARSRQGWT